MIRIPKLISLTAAAFVALATAAHAEDKAEPEKSCEGNTFQIVECLKARTAEWDKRMNTAYQQATKDAANAKQREQLRAAQRLWIQYRDANCLYYGLGEGTIARVEAGECMRDMTKARAEELEGIGQQ